MERAFRPMLAVDAEEDRLRFPYVGTPKIDAVRCLIYGQALTRSLKPFANEYVREFFRRHADALHRLDGELCVGDPTAPGCFSRSMSGLTSEAGRPDMNFFVFDLIDPSRQMRFADRAIRAQEQIRKAKLANVFWLPSQKITTLRDLRQAEEVILGQGFEGVMLRDPRSLYKFGRATLNENSLLKVKRFRDAEAIVLGTEEQMHNTNTATRNAIGRTQRSSAQAGLVGKDTLGALIVKGAPGQPFAGAQFNIGTGFNDAQRERLWADRSRLKGKLVRYRFFEFGSKDAPRHPIFTGFREAGT